MPDVPHFKVPFQLSQGRVVVVEQDTLDEVAQCVAAVLACPEGARLENPDFGTPEYLLTEAPIDVDELVNAVNEHEPRAGVIIEEAPETWDGLVRRVTARVQGGVAGE